MKNLSRGVLILFFLFLCLTQTTYSSSSSEFYFKRLANSPGVVINELLPSPEGSDAKEEWIEIFNQNDFKVDLSGWQITDIAGKTRTFTFPPGTEISGHGFLILSRSITKITLNNDRDGLNLLQPDGKIVDSVIYEKAPKGQSYNRLESKWFWSSTLTPGSTNIIPASNPEIKKSDFLKKNLATFSEQPSEKFSLPIFFVALSVAIFSGIIILTIKRKIKDIDLSKNLE